MASFNVRSDAADYLSRVRSRSWWGDWERASAAAMGSMSGDPISQFMANAGSYSDWDAEGQALAQGQIDWINKQKADQQLLGGAISISSGTWEDVGDVAAAGAVAGLAAGAAYAGGLAMAPEAAAGAGAAAEGATVSTVGGAAGGEFGLGAASYGTGASTATATTVGSGITATTVPTATIGAGGGLAAGGLAAEGIEFADSGAAAMDLGISEVSRAATTSVASGLSGSDLLLAANAAPMLLGLAAGDPEMEVAGAASMDMGAKPAPKENPALANKERAMELRRAAAERSAQAAGAKRFKNEADLLGQTGRTTQRKKAGQQRVVLGY